MNLKSLYKPLVSRDQVHMSTSNQCLGSIQNLPFVITQGQLIHSFPCHNNVLLLSPGHRECLNRTLQRELQLWNTAGRCTGKAGGRLGGVSPRRATRTSPEPPGSNQIVGGTSHCTMGLSVALRI